jgi:hypothetical protein
MKCSEVRGFLSEINYHTEPVTPIPPADFGYLSANGYVQTTTRDDHDKGVADVAGLSQLTMEIAAEKPVLGQAYDALDQDQEKEHSFSFHFQGKGEKDALAQRIEDESNAAIAENTKLTTMEFNLNALLQKKSAFDRMVAYGDQYLSLTGNGVLVLNDLNVRNYRVADDEFTDFVTELGTTYSELRSIADRAKSYVALLGPRFPVMVDDLTGADVLQPVLWSTGIGLGKLKGDPAAIGARASQALSSLQSFSLLNSLKSTPPSMLLAAEVMTSLGGQDIESLKSTLQDLHGRVKKEGVPGELSVGVAATIMAGRRFDGTYPIDTFKQFKQQTPSFEAAAILGVMNTPFADLIAKFKSFRGLLSSWGYTASEDLEIAAAFLAIGELGADDVQDKLKYVVQQLTNYLEYPLVAGAILASIPVFEAHEVLDLMEKAVALLKGYLPVLERSEVVTLAVRMIHGVRNELVKQIDSTATISQTPVQFTYGWYPGLFRWYFPVIIAHSTYNASFSGMGGFHPAHSHGIGGFAG